MKLKKGLTLAALTLCASTVFGQTANVPAADVDERPYEFNKHWFLQVQGGMGMTRGEADFSDLTSVAAAIYGGYQFTPVVGVRVGVSGWNAKGGWVSPYSTYGYKYLQGNVDAMFDLSALLCKYNPKRFFNVYAFAGVGLNCAFDNDEAITLNNQGYELGYLWSNHRFSPAGRAGLGINLRLADRLAFNIEGNANIVSDHFNSKKADNPDFQFNVMAGFTIRLGKTYKVKPAPVAVPEPVQPVEREEPKPQPKPTPKPQPEVKKEVVKEALTENVFFLINSAKVRQS